MVQSNYVIYLWERGEWLMLINFIFIIQQIWANENGLLYIVRVILNISLQDDVYKTSLDKQCHLQCTKQQIID